jgi:Fe-S-cluster containining protein
MIKLKTMGIFFLVIVLSENESDERDYFESLITDFLCWLADMLTHFNRIKDLFKKTPPLIAHQNATIEYHCVNCGKCCHFDEHNVWVSPEDIVEWLKRYNHDRRIGLLLFSLAQVEDTEGYLGLAMLSKQSLSEFIAEAKKEKGFPKETIKIYEQFQNQLEKRLKRYNKEENSCIFYDPDSEYHCSIYDIRPNQCKTYPYDYPRFSRINPGLSKLKTYGIDAIVVKEEAETPYCPEHAYTPQGQQGYIKITNENLEHVNLDKVAYVTSEETEDLMTEDLVELIAELFYQDILNPSKPNKAIQKELTKFLKNTQEYAENLRYNKI